MRIEIIRGLPLESRGLRAFLGTIGLMAIAAARFFPFDQMPPICTFRRLTGHPCVGCGMTRSWVHFAHGRAADAFVQSPLGAVLFLAMIGALLYLALRSFTGIPALRVRMNPVSWWVLGGTSVVLVAIHWLYLELSGVAL
ncbi:MAG: hypothetical protein CL928_17505 [Deltaproteobacteria bacterium]|nr:hypothetical protein [Deltaproteobacteria bacterium]